MCKINLDNKNISDYVKIIYYLYDEISVSKTFDTNYI